MPIDPELSNKLEEIRTLTKENHKMLRAMRRAQIIGTISRIVIWLFFILVPLYIFQVYAKPIINKIQSLKGAPASTNFLGLPSSEEFQKLLDSYRMQ